METFIFIHKERRRKLTVHFRIPSLQLFDKITPLATVIMKLKSVCPNYGGKHKLHKSVIVTTIRLT
jgi:hypothetical protein